MKRHTGRQADPAAESKGKETLKAPEGESGRPTDSGETECLFSENAVSHDSARGRYIALLRSFHRYWIRQGNEHAARLFLTLRKVVEDWAEDEELHTCTMRKHRNHITEKITTTKTQ